MNKPLLKKDVKLWFFMLLAAFGMHAQNNECSNAVPIDPQDDVNSDVQVVANFNGATMSTPAPACSFTFSPTAGDLWYTFTANAAKYILDANEYLKAELYEGTGCGDLSYMYCKNGLAYLDNLEVGTHYYLKLINNSIQAGDSPDNQFLFRLVKAPDAPATDLCENAVLLTGTVVSANMVGANMEYPALPLYITAQSVLGDVWFKFTATENFATVVISPTSLGIGQPDHGLHAGLFTGNCGTLTAFQDLGSFDSFGNGATTDTSQLQIGQTYYIRVYYYSVTENWPFTINIIPRPSPANDGCDNANNVVLDADGETSFSVPSLTYATPTTPSVPSTCNGSTAKDVWYKFTAGVPNYLVTSSSQITVYSGSCGSLAQVACGTGFILNNMSVGSVYYIRVFNGQTITIREYAAEDECTTATLLVPAANPVFVYSSTTNATQSASATTCLASNKDVWFKFVATSTKHKLSTSNGYGTNANDALAITLYSGDCNALVQMACYSFQSTPNYEPVVDTFVVGQTYYIKATRGAGTYFGVKVIHINTQPNNEVANAIAVIPGAPGTCSYISGSTEGADVSAALPSVCNGTGAYKDVWYSFTATSELYYIRLNTAGFHKLSIYKETTPGSMVLFSCLIGNLSGFEIGTTYFMRIAKTASDVDPQLFEFCISAITDAPANDECANAIDVTVAPTVACGTPTLVNLTNGTYNVLNVFASNCVESDEDKDVWYRFTANATQMLVNNPSTVPYTGFKYVVFESDNCNNFSCHDISYLNEGSTRIVSGLTVGQSYLLLITYTQANNVMFCLSSVPTITNDTCLTPTTITPSPGLACVDTIVNYRGVATPATSLTVSGCAPGFNLYLDNPNPSLVDYNDVWYQFTATAAEHMLDFLGGSTVQAVQLFSGTCSNLVCAGNTVYTNGKALFSGLVAGNTYFIRIIEQQTDYLGTYQFCLKTLMPIPDNDEYANAINLVPSGDLDTCNPVSNYFNRATFSNNVQAPSCINEGQPKDVWFKFTATNPDHQLQIHLSNPAALGITFETSLYTSSNDVVTQEIYCFDPFANIANLDIPLTGFTVFNVASYFPLSLQNYTGLTVGNTYYVRVYPFTDPGLHFSIPMTYDICLKTLPEIPVNKDVANAVELAISANDNLDYVSGYATRAAYHVTEPFNIDTNPCAELNAFAYPSNQASNVWYKFTATGTAHELHVVNDANVLFPMTNYVATPYYPLYAALYEYNNAVLETKLCYAEITSGLVFNNLEAGKEYYVKMMYGQIHFLTDFEFQVALDTPELGIPENMANSIVVFPNPAKGVLNINGGQMQIQSVEIYTILGQSVMKLTQSGTEFNVDVASLAPGTYIIKLNSEEGSSHRKFVKE